MHCEICNRSVPADSRFCPFCGRPITATPQTAPVRRTLVDHQTTYCRLCGKPIDDETKVCSGCGKQYFRGIKPMVFLCIVLILAVLALSAVAIAQSILYAERIDELLDIIASYERAQ